MKSCHPSSLKMGYKSEALLRPLKSALIWLLAPTFYSFALLAVAMDGSICPREPETVANR